MKELSIDNFCMNLKGTLKIGDYFHGHIKMDVPYYIPWSLYQLDFILSRDNKLNFCCNFGQLLHQYILVKVHIISNKNVRVTSISKSCPKSQRKITLLPRFIGNWFTILVGIHFWNIPESPLEHSDERFQYQNLYNWWTNSLPFTIHYSLLLRFIGALNLGDV